jgi:hypothetical protein
VIDVLLAFFDLGMGDTPHCRRLDPNSVQYRKYLMVGIDLAIL